MRALAGLVPLAALLAGCGPPPPVRFQTCAAAPRPAVSVSADGRTASATLSVLTYNIEGLGWPARKGRAEPLRAIGATLARLNAAGRAPDVVLVQEMFSPAAKRAITASGYPAIMAGPGRTSPPAGTAHDPLPGKARAKRGEIGLKLLGSGLVVASRYPIVDNAFVAFGKRACAGLDCLANKGVMLARIALPGVPSPVAIYNTHLNSRGASRAPRERTLAAHDRQSAEVADFIESTHDRRAPVVLGGDFNMKHAERRWQHFSSYAPLDVVHAVCNDPDYGCDVRMSWDGDAPWMDTQDLQLFADGTAMTIRPIRVEAMFDGADQPQLSDHDGFLVTYRLRWPVGIAAATGACAG